MSEQNKKQESKAVVKGNVVMKKESKLRSVYNIFFSATPDEVAKSLVSKVIVPAIQRTIGDVWKRSGDMFLWGVDSKGSRRDDRRPIRDYSSYSRFDDKSSQNKRRDESSRADSWKQLGFDVKSDCEDIILGMEEDLIEYNEVTVARLLELAGLVPDTIHYDWGWRNLDGADCEIDNRDGLWYLILPKMVRL